MVLAVVGRSAPADAAPLFPPGLNAGDTYRIAFVTSTFRDATSTNIVDYNAFVTAAANSEPLFAALGVTWFAIGSTAATSAITNIGSSLPVPPFAGIFNTSGQLVATGTVDLCDSFDLLSPINFDEHGAAVPPSLVYTGSLQNCGIGPLALGGGLVVGVGYSNPNPGYSSWIDGASGFAPDPYAFYGISGEITVSDIPEPGTSGLTALGMGLFFLAKMRRRHRRPGAP